MSGHPWSIPVDVTLTLGTLTINTTSADAAHEGTLTAVESLTVDWARPSLRGHEEPGTLTLTLRHPRPGLIALGDRIAAWCTPTATAPLSLGAWWVESCTWAQAPSGAWIYEVTATNAIGRASGVRLAASPWPSGWVRLADRIASINAASPFTLVAHDTSADTAVLLGRDVDSADALDIIQRTAMSYGRFAVAGPHSIALARPAATHVRMPRYEPPRPPAVLVDRGRPPAPLPASRVENSGRELSRRGLVTAVKVSYHLLDLDSGDTTEEARSWRSPAAHLPPAALAFDTDLLVETSAADPLDPATVHLGAPGSIAAGIAAEGTTPRPLLAPARCAVGLGGLPLTDLIEIGHRASAILTLDGAPADLERLVHIAASTIHIARGRLALSVTLAPAATAGVRPLRWTDFPTPTDVPYQPATLDLVAARFAHCGPLSDPFPPADQLRIGDTAAVDAPTFWKAQI
ncbi:MAG: hypothetical protein QM708_13505 [Propioniciclava sp.]|uniref:hypothetical protein n=1 Tax=Propioniciclava sp. TaxID=2038686 RepID=UPI0039E6930A